MNTKYVLKLMLSAWVWCAFALTALAQPTPKPATKARTAVAPNAAVAALPSYKERFNILRQKIYTKGYMSPDGIPYHSIESLICEAPDQGHETTSESFSYWLYLEAMHGRITGNWTPLNNAWTAMEKYIIPTNADQPTNQFYKASDPADYGPEHPLPENYPALLSSAIPVGQDPVSPELKATYGTDDIYGMHWLLDCDNFYGYGNRGDGTSTPSYINTFQRGPQESVWETVPHPSWETYKWGSPTGGFLPIFIAGPAPAKQWRYTNAPDADARVVQALYWASLWSKEQNVNPNTALPMAKAAKMGDYLRLSMFDKYFKKMNVQDPAGPAGTGYESSHYLISWYYAWGGNIPDPGSTSGWAFRIGCSHNHFGYQNPVAAWALSNVNELKPRSTNGATDWAKSLERQIEFYQYLQSADGPIAGGATNSWEGAYKPYPAGQSTFYGMAYDPHPVYRDPGSNTWPGWQAWSMERMAEYYYLTNDVRAKQLLDKWYPWFQNHIKLLPGNDFLIPASFEWRGQPDTWVPGAPVSPNRNANLRIIEDSVKYGRDIGITACFAKTFAYYAAALKKYSTAPADLGRSGDAQDLSRELLDRMWITYSDDKGISAPEERDDFKRFFTQKVHIPTGYSGKMANGDVVEPGATFLSIRSKYKDDPDFAKLEASYRAGTPYTQRYHRTWAQIEVALASADYGFLFPDSSSNNRPVARFTYTATPVNRIAPVAVSFNASTSTDADGDPLTFTWDFGDGSAAGTGVTTSRTYATKGNYIVTLTANDGKGGIGIKTDTIRVLDDAPVASFTATPMSGNVALNVVFNASASVDPRGGTLTYNWTFGDGATGTGRTTTHSFTNIGLFPVVLTVSNGTKSSTATKTIEVKDTAAVTDYKVEYKDGDGNVSDGSIRPHFRIINESTTPLDLRNVKLRYWFTQENPSNTLNFWCDHADIGQGNVVGTFVRLPQAVNGADTYLEVSFRGGTVGPRSNSGEIQTRFAKENWSAMNEANDYSFDGTKTAFALHRNVVMYINNARVWGTAPAGVINPPPTLTASFTATPMSGTAPLTVSLDASASTGTAPLSYSWSFGDGTSGTGRTVTRTYTIAGSYIITLTVGSGTQTVTATKTIVVTTGGGGGNCSFGTPLASALPSINKAYNRIKVLGTGGPNLSNVTSFNINWDLQNRGLYQIAMQTNNGQPNWYVDLSSKATHTFASASPGVKFTGSGFSGMDGEYYVNVVNGDFVMVAKSGRYAIYFSDKEITASCSSAARQGVVATDIEPVVAYPNPSSSVVNVRIQNAASIKSIRVVNQYGTQVDMLATEHNGLENGKILTFGQNLSSGIYVITVEGVQTVKNYRVILVK